MEVFQHRVDDIVTLTFLDMERVDALSAPNVKEYGLKLIDKGEKKIILNFANIKYISTAGIACLLALTAAMKREKGEVILTNLDPNIYSIFQTMGLLRKNSKVLFICDNQQEALEWLQHARP